MTVTIDKREYILSPRRASDVLDMAMVAENIKETDSAKQVLSMAKIVCDSLKATYLLLGRIRGWRYRKFTEKRGVRLLLVSLSMKEVGEACNAVLEDVEGSKKKDRLTGSPSAGTSAGG